MSRKKKGVINKMTTGANQNEDHWQLSSETIELEHKHQYIHTHNLDELEKYELGDVQFTHFHNANPHTHQMILTPTDYGYSVTHPPLLP